MNQVPPMWVTLVSPVASLLGTMLMVMLGFYLQNRSIENVIGLLTAEMKEQKAEIREQIAGLERRISKELSAITHRLERIGPSGRSDNLVKLS